MVSLERMTETTNGFASAGVVYVDPEYVMLVEQALCHLAISRVKFSDGSVVYVTGTPDEVAKKIKKGKS